MTTPAFKVRQFGNFVRVALSVDVRESVSATEDSSLLSLLRVFVIFVGENDMCELGDDFRLKLPFDTLT